MIRKMRAVVSDILERVRADPYAVLGQASLGCLRVFLDGYLSGCARAGSESDLDPRLGRFSEWVAEKLGRGLLSVSGYCMIRLECADEAQALGRYFELWDEYTSQVEPVPIIDSASQTVWPGLAFRQLLADVQRRPALFFGHTSATLLGAFIRGYVAAFESAGRPPEEVPDLEGFSRWLCVRHGLREGFRWDRILLLFNWTEAAAFKDFFLLLTKYEAGVDPRDRS